MNKSSPTFEDQKCAEGLTIKYHDLSFGNCGAPLGALWYHGPGFYWQVSGDPVGPFESVAAAHYDASFD